MPFESLVNFVILELKEFLKWLTSILELIFSSKTIAQDG